MKHIFAIIAAVALVWAFLPAPNPLPEPQPAPQPTPTPVVVPTSPVTAALLPATKQDKARVAAFYSAMADVVERDPKLVKTVGNFRELHARSLDAAFKGTDLPGKYPGLDLAINDRLKAAVGTDDVPLPPAKQQLLVQALKDVANDAR